MDQPPTTVSWAPRRIALISKLDASSFSFNLCSPDRPDWRELVIIGTRLALKMKGSTQWYAWNRQQSGLSCLSPVKVTSGLSFLRESNWPDLCLSSDSHVHCYDIMSTRDMGWHTWFITWLETVGARSGYGFPYLVSNITDHEGTDTTPATRSFKVRNQAVTGAGINLATASTILPSSLFLHHFWCILGYTKTSMQAHDVAHTNLNLTICRSRSDPSQYQV